MEFDDPVCPESEECLGGLLAGPVDDEELLRYRAHLAGCASCEHEWRSLKPIAELLRQAFSRDVAEHFDNA